MKTIMNSGGGGISCTYQCILLYTCIQNLGGGEVKSTF